MKGRVFPLQWISKYLYYSQKLSQTTSMGVYVQVTSMRAYVQAIKDQYANWEYPILIDQDLKY
jgi:hypothetical protein